MDTEQVVKSTQEQAVGAWINYLNQVRLDRLMASLSQQNKNLDAAMETIERTFNTIKADIIGRNRGGNKGMHGFIAEIAECGIGNARQQIIGKTASYLWVNDNGPVDLLRGTEQIQQKFVQAGGHLSLRAIMEHLHHYPDFVVNGGKYQIPKGHYDKIIEYMSMPESVANKLPTSTGEFSLRQWKEVHTFFDVNGITPSDLEPSILEYGDVQQGGIATTIEREREQLAETDQRQRDAAYQKSKPTLAEGAKAAAVGAAVEGVTSFCISVVKKRKAGKKIKDFDRKDWQDVAGDSGKGFLKGGVRGTSIYMLTNYTATPAAVASAVTTAAFGVAEQAHMYRNGAINEVQFIENSEILCLDATVSALASFAGQVIIPVPVIGAIIGNAVGTLIYQIGKDTLSHKENEIIEAYLKELNALDGKLSSEYQIYVAGLSEHYSQYLEILSMAFDPDVYTAFEGSISLAEKMGVPAEDILDSHIKIVNYFED